MLGLDGIDLEGEDFALRMNQVSGDGSDQVIDYKTKPLSLDSSKADATQLDFDGKLGALF